MRDEVSEGEGSAGKRPSEKDGDEHGQVLDG